MRRILPLLAVGGFTILALGAPPASAQSPKDKTKPKQKYDPPAIVVPAEEVLGAIKAKTAELAARIAELRKDKKNHALLPDVEIFLRGAENIVRYKEYYSKDSAKWTLDVLDRGLKRSAELAKGETPWTQLKTQNVLRAYRSMIDDTAQPYGVTYPLGYGKDPKKKWRVDVVLHGRNNSLTEVAFINSHSGKKKVEPEQDWVQIDIFGRGNNAYRWAGESDVIDAKTAFFLGEIKAGRGDLVHPQRVVLRGFSMGGAGTWNLGLRHPSFWNVMNPGAGFTTTHNYAWKGKQELPDYQEKCLRIYDALDYAENARMIPIIAYSGSADGQKLAADNIENRLKELKIDTMTHLVAPGLGHTFPADWFKKANALWSPYAAKPRDAFPRKLSFVTFSTKSPLCDWVNVVALERHYEKASVDGELTPQGCRLTTKNVRWLGLHLDSPKYAAIEIDGQTIADVAGEFPSPRPDTPDKLQYGTFLVKEGGRWSAMKIDDVRKLAEKTLIKRTFLQGPIDDAFAYPFVCVLGSGETWHPDTQKFVDAKVAALRHDWGKHWRGELPTTGDYAVTPNDIMDKNLVLFGDPSSNLTLAQILPKLPLKWTKDEIEFAGKKYKASEHVPVMIFPNPLSPNHYVVLNTGHTFPSEDYTKTNAMLYPRLGDYAILRMTPGPKNADAFDVAVAGLFDDNWQIEKK